VQPRKNNFLSIYGNPYQHSDELKSEAVKMVNEQGLSQEEAGRQLRIITYVDPRTGYEVDQNDTGETRWGVNCT